MQVLGKWVDCRFIKLVSTGILVNSPHFGPGLFFVLLLLLEGGLLIAGLFIADSSPRRISSNRSSIVLLNNWGNCKHSAEVSDSSPTQSGDCKQAMTISKIPIISHGIMTMNFSPHDICITIRGER